MKVIGDALQQVAFGEAITYRNLTMFPLLDHGAGEPDYLTLDEALAKGFARVTEVSAGGSVPDLKFVNEGDCPVFLLDGEELIGAKQNRVLNLSILVPAKQTVVIPVSCVEAGRWAHVSEEFTPAPRAHYAAGRARKMEQVTAHLCSLGEARSDQGAIWDDIAAKSVRMEASSPTQAMAAIYERHSEDVEEYVRAFRPAERQSGALFAINGEIVGLDLFDYEATLEKLLPKLVRSYALDAIESVQPNVKAPAPEAVREFVGQVAGATAQQFAAIGLGEDTRLTGDGCTGGALIAEGRLVHLSAFRRAGAPGRETFHSGASLSRPSARRHHWQGT